MFWCSRWVFKTRIQTKVEALCPTNLPCRSFVTISGHFMEEAAKCHALLNARPCGAEGMFTASHCVEWKLRAPVIHAPMEGRETYACRIERKLVFAAKWSWLTGAQLWMATMRFDSVHHVAEMQLWFVAAAPDQTTVAVNAFTCTRKNVWPSWYAQHRLRQSWRRSAPRVRCELLWVTTTRVRSYSINHHNLRLPTVPSFWGEACYVLHTCNALCTLCWCCRGEPWINFVPFAMDGKLTLRAVQVVWHVVILLFYESVLLLHLLTCILVGYGALVGSFCERGKSIDVALL